MFLQNRLLGALPTDERANLEPHLARVELDRGRVLYDPGDPIDLVYFPTEGVISLLTLMRDGATIGTAMIGPHNALGLTAAAAPRQAFSRAVVQTRCQAGRISTAQLHELWKRNPRLRQIVDRHAQAQYGEAVQSAACNALHSAEARLARWLLACHDGAPSSALNLTQEDAAGALGVQRTTVTGAAKALQTRGVMRYRRGSVEIVDRPGLEAVACECYGAIRGIYDRLLA